VALGGFLADAFQVFKNHGLSVDLVSTSETNVTVSLDPLPIRSRAQPRTPSLVSCRSCGRVAVIGPCAAVELVGKNIRAICTSWAKHLSCSKEQKIY